MAAGRNNKKVGNLIKGTSQGAAPAVSPKGPIKVPSAVGLRFFLTRPVWAALQRKIFRESAAAGIT